MNPKCAKHKRLFVVFCMIGWWGFLYPEATINKDTCRIVTEETTPVTVQNGEEVVEWEEDAFQLVKNAKPGQIRFRSKLYIMLRSFLAK